MNSLSTYQIILTGLLIILNLHSFYLYYSDKQRAIQRKYRIPEKKLLLFTIVFGGLGAYIGMTMFRHKTKQLTFKIVVPISMLLTLAALIFILIFLPII